MHPQDIERCIETYYTWLLTLAGHSRWNTDCAGTMGVLLDLDKGVPRYAGSGDFVGYIGSCIDISDRKRIEELNSDLVHMQRLAVIGELTATISHELRQPLSAILLNTTVAETLLKSASPPLDKIREILSDVHNSLSHANDVIERTGDLSRRSEIYMRPVDINAIMSDALTLGLQARQRSVRFVPNRPPGFR